MKLIGSVSRSCIVTESFFAEKPLAFLGTSILCSIFGGILSQLNGTFRPLLTGSQVSTKDSLPLEYKYLIEFG